MMRKLIGYIATSANGFIADENGSVEWLENLPVEEGDDYGYAEFLETVDTTIQGYSTYEQLIGWDIEFPYKEKVNYVVTRKSNPTDNGFVTFLGEDFLKKIEELKKEDGNAIWLVGGGKLNASCMNAGLIDELIVFHMPIFLPAGIPLFDGLDRNVQLPAPEVKTYPSGAVELKYNLNKVK